MTQLSTDTLARYYKGGPVGVGPGQSMFVTDSTRSGLMDARSSFVRMLNIIFARNPVAIDRVEAVNQMTVETPIAEYLVWRRPTGTRHIEVIPPTTEWDFQVYMLEERDFMLADPTFSALVLANESPRILVNGLGNQDTPQWSVYQADLPTIPEGQDPAAYVASNPKLVFTLAKSYDFHVSSFNDRDTLLIASPPISIGQRVLVDGNSSTSGFWTVWQYLGTESEDPEIDASGFKLVRYQTYRTRDFWDYIDWYATGYSSTVLPVVRYATIKDRDTTENPVPKTIFVRVDDDGTGSWIWTAYADGAWTVVARQNGTIQLSANFYNDNTRPVIGFEPISSSVLAQIPFRDGSWEFQVLFNILQDDTLLEDLEINELFFSMLHFIHAQQDQVGWAFKTSFLNVGGYNEALTQTPVEPIDNTSNLLNYIEEVKPYRVKTRNFTQIVTPSTDIANTRVTDFDFPLYYDTTTGKYRNLSLTLPSDLAIIQSNYPWKDWYDNYTNTNFDPDTYLASTWNGVRHFTITMRFDRVDHMPLLWTQKFTYAAARPDALAFILDIDPTLDISTKLVEVFVNDRLLLAGEFSASQDTVVLTTVPTEGDTVKINVRDSLTSGLAADRIQQFYDPTNAEAAEKNLRSLMGLNFKSNQMDGGDLQDNSNSDYTISGTPTGDQDDEVINPDEHHYAFADPAMEADRPEELISTGTGESLQMIQYDPGDKVGNAISNATSIVMARPATDLLAPHEIGDFDARPLDTTLYDHGVAGEQGIQPTNGATLSKYQNIYDIRSDAWEFGGWNNVGGHLTSDLTATSNSISITPTDVDVLPFIAPQIEEIDIDGQARETITKPGVVWINRERIEFFQYEEVDGVYILTQLRRGTFNTRIGAEQRQVVSYNEPNTNNPAHGVNHADGLNTVFTLANTTTVTGIEVMVNEALRYADGNIITSDGYTGYSVLVSKVSLLDYTVTVSGSKVQVTFVKAPSLGSTVVLAQSISNIHPAGTPIYNNV